MSAAEWESWQTLEVALQDVGAEREVAHVLPAATRARDDLASGGIVRGGALMGREGCELVVPLPLSLREVLDRESDWRRCIAAELVACTLGQRRRPELVAKPYDMLRNEYADQPVESSVGLGCHGLLDAEG